MNGTRFEEVYCMTNVLTDNGKMKVLPINQFYQYMFKCLQFSVGEFKRPCYESLEYDEPFSQYEFNFVTDGVDQEFEIPIGEYVDDVYKYTKQCYNNHDFNIYIGYRANSDDAYTEISDYEYIVDDIYNPIIKLPAVPDCNLEFYISLYKIGKFKENLSQKVINILATGCEVPYLNEKMTKEQLLEQHIYSNSVNSFSQAQHITALTKIYDSVFYKNFKAEINKYTYSYANNLTGLADGKNGFVGDNLWH